MVLDRRLIGIGTQYRNGGKVVYFKTDRYSGW